MKKREISIPFCGFYESAADSRIDHEIESFYDSEGTGNNHVPESFYMDFHDYSTIREEYSRIYVDSFQEWLSDMDITLNLEYAALDSPKFYNYSTDRIFANVPLNDLRELYRNVNKGTLAAIIKERFTSYDGFCSHYSNSLSDWQNEPLPEWDANQWETVLLAAIGNCEINEWEIMECNYGYESVSNSVHNKIGAWDDERTAALIA